MEAWFASESKPQREVTVNPIEFPEHTTIMKKTQRPQHFLKKPPVTLNTTPPIPQKSGITTSTTIDPIEILERIANWPADSNSDPDVMGDALDQIQQLASDTVRSLRSQADECGHS